MRKIINSYISLNRRSISKDLTVSLFITVMLATSAIAFYAYHTQGSRMMDELHAKADEAIGKAADVLAIPLWNLDNTSVRMVGAAFAYNEQVEAVRITDARGKVLFETYKGSGQKTISRASDVAYNGVVIGHAEISYTLGGYNSQMNTLLWSGIIGIVAAGGVILMATGLLLRVFMRKPLEQLRQGTRRVAAGDYSYRFELPQKELFEIVEHFEEMSRAVASREADLHRMNIELRRAEEKYHSIFENAIEGIFQTTKEGRFLSANPSMAVLLGYDSPNDLIDTVTDILHQIYVNPSDREKFMTHLMEHGRIANFEVEFTKKSGTIIWVSISAQTIHDSKGKIAHIEGSMVDITVRKKMEDELRHQALHDPLTGLANRALCLDRILQAMERHRRRTDYIYAVLFVDLDRFKVINDSLGHTVGDSLLREVGQRLIECVRDLDTVSRFGGDEFIILLEELESTRQAIRVVKRVREALRTPFAITDHKVRVTASIGIVLGSMHGESPEDVIQKANIAMHRSKDTGRDRFKVFTPKLLDQAELLLTLENDMERGIRRNEFFIEYHPIMFMNGTPSIWALEALTRWKHPTRGMLGPNEFIPVAEETGQIVSLGMWVLRNACQTFSDWRKAVPMADKLMLSVNISGRQFAQVDLVDSVLGILQDTGLPPDRLKLEITETAIMQNAEIAIDKLSALRARGIRISVDDFGTGYSSMSYLQKLPLDSLKIDLSFVRGMTDSPGNVEIVKAIINLAHSLGLEVIAEGVERKEHEHALQTLKCEYLQGYYYTRPLPQDLVPKFIATHPPLEV